jgi:HD-GYP domain-containing protein (c-di-GMP phosphodiesterase class II)/DNA-binding CsgD family transcriptional regulator
MVRKSSVNSADDQPSRLAELIAALSLATDLGMGQPMEQALNTCLLSMKVSRELALPDADLSDVYYLALLRFVGCTADAHAAAAAVGGNEIGDRAGLATVLMGEMSEFLGYMLRHYAEDQPPITRMRLLVSALTEGSGAAKRSIAEHCEVAQMLVARMGINKEVGVYVGCTFERWDGKGLPGELAGEAIPVPARIVSVARDVDIFQRLGGWPLTANVLQRRRGKAYDPVVVNALLAGGERWLAEIGGVSTWDAVLAAEPRPYAFVSGTRLDDVLSTFADFADLKCPYAVGHSTLVAGLAEEAAKVLGLDERDAQEVRRAGLVHDLGITGIPNGIWDKPGPLSHAEWERVRLHPYLTERILSYSKPLTSLAALAGAHHERLDGSGYHRGSATPLPIQTQVLAAADAYQAMTQPRPYRLALDRTARERELEREVAAGRLDRNAVRAVLAVSGHAVAPKRHAWPAGLTDREVEVLRLISQGHSNRVVAQELVISAKTVGRHIENIYGKIGVSSRAAAALFAMEHQIIHA